MTVLTAQGLKLTISNPTEIASGQTTEHIFSERGGSIGSARNDTWQLSAHRTGAVGGHAEIRLVDGAFCLIDRSGRTYINSASQPVGRGRRARLTTGDVISIGRYRIQAGLVCGESAESTHDGLMGEDWNQLVDGQEADLKRRSPTLDPQEPEPLTGLSPAPAERISDDPLDGFRPAPDDSETSGPSDHDELLADKPDWLRRGPGVTDEYRDNRDAALGLPVLHGRGDRMSTHTRIDSRNGRTPTDRKDASRTHIGGAPLLRGLATDLNFQDSDDMRLFMEEAGQTLRATIDGLLALHQSEDSRHQALRTRLQPIEDNPLRLGQGRDDTIQTLFASERSPVHLSAPAAVSESLQGLQHHQQATQAAIREALDAILQAFSPAALLRRFHGYRRGLQTGEDEPAWAWQMYQHYYAELNSSRQQGFERLFQEVFEQAYDQHLRQLQRESTL